MNLLDHKGVLIRAEPGVMEKDSPIVDEVVERDCYRLRALHASGFSPRVIVDIGAHIGSFVVLAHQLWPTARIWAFEPCLDYFRVLAVNQPQNAVTVNVAVLGFYPKIPFALGYLDPEPNTDAERWRYQGPAISFTTVLDMVGRAPDLLKIDCEGCEGHIIREMLQLSPIPMIVGEWHGRQIDVVRRLPEYGYDLEILDCGGGCDTFFASLTARPAAV